MQLKKSFGKIVQKTWFLWSVSFILVTGFTLLAIYVKHWPNILGFNGKTFWDLLDLAIIPLVLILITKVFSQTEQKRVEARERQEKELEEIRVKQREFEAIDRIREAEWQSYIDRMAELMEKGLHDSEMHSTLQNIARVLTLTTLLQLDGKRKSLLLKFLYEADLIVKKTYMNISSTPTNQLITVESHKAQPVVFLHEADLSKAELSGANLAGANLMGINMQDVDLSKASLFQTLLWSADLTKADLQETNLMGAMLNNAILNEANLSKADMYEAYLKGAELKNANLQNAQLSHAVLEDAQLQGADLRGANLEYANLFRSQIDDQTKLDRKWEIVWKAVNNQISSKDLRDIDLSNAYLSTEVTDNFTRSIHLQHSDLRGANFVGSCLIKASFYDSDLRNANLRGADLRRSGLAGANLQEADLSNADLRGANLAGANLKGTKIENAQLDSKWQLIWQIVNSGEVAQDLSKVDLVWANLSGIDLSQTDFSGADLSYANLCGTNLSNAIISREQLESATYDSFTCLPEGLDLVEQEIELINEIINEDAIVERPTEANV